MTLYEQAKQIVDSPVDIPQIPLPDKLPEFRRYLSTLAAAKNKKFTTKVVGNKLTIKQFYEL